MFESGCQSTASSPPFLGFGEIQKEQLVLIELNTSLIESKRVGEKGESTDDIDV